MKRSLWLLVAAPLLATEFVLPAAAALKAKPGQEADARLLHNVTLHEKGVSLADFCTELHHNKSVSDATYGRALAKFKEQGIIDLVGINGYYTFLSMVMNVARTPPPKDAESTLASFPR